MKMVYTHENRFFVNNAKNIIEGCGIQSLLKNEYAAGAAGDLAPMDAWLELWVIDDRDHTRALTIIENAFNHHSTDTWTCTYCKEINEPAFDICWSCQKEPANRGDHQL